MQHIAGGHLHAEDPHRHAGAHNAEVAMAGDAAPGEVVEAQRANFRNVAHGTVAHGTVAHGTGAHGTVANQADRSKSREEGGHHFAAVGGVVAVAAHLPQHDDGGLGRGLDEAVELDKLIELEGRCLADGLHLRRHSIATHAPEFREQAAEFERREAFAVGAKFQLFNGIDERGRVDGFEIVDPVGHVRKRT